MNAERLRRIIEYSDRNRKDIEGKVKKFYSMAGLEEEQEVLNIMQVARSLLQKQGYMILELPFADKEIGALCYKGNALGYIVINSSLPKVNTNFALCHELYHVFYQQTGFRPKIEFVNEHYYEHEEEFAANLFAGMLLMPEVSFRCMYQKFYEESEKCEKDTFIRLMNYYQVPYMSAVIRSYELELPETDRVTEEILNTEQEVIRERLQELWLDDRLLDATKKDDYVHLKKMVLQIGEEGKAEGYLNERTVRKVLQNMQAFYEEIKGEQ